MSADQNDRQDAQDRANTSSGWNRREFLRNAAGFGLGATALNLFGCAGPTTGEATPTATTPPTATSASMAAATATQEETPVPAAQQDVTIGLGIHTEQQLIWVRAFAGAVAAADELGANLVTGRAPTGGGWPEFTTALEGLIDQGVDALIIPAIPPEVINPLVERALGQDIVVIGMNTLLWNTPAITNPDWSHNLALMMEVVRRTGGSGNMVTFYSPGLQSSYEFLQSIQEDMTEFWFPNLEIISTLPATFPGTLEKAQENFGQVLTQNPNPGDIRAVMHIFDHNVVGAYNAAKAAGRANEMIFVGAAGDPLAFDALLESDGTTGYVAEVWYNFEHLGRLCVEHALRALDGQDLPVVRFNPGLMVYPDLAPDAREINEATSDLAASIIARREDSAENLQQYRELMADITQFRETHADQVVGAPSLP